MLSIWWIGPLGVAAATAVALELLARRLRDEASRLRRATVETHQATLAARARAGKVGR